MSAGRRWSTVPEPWHWLSFADGSLPVGQQFLGGAWLRGYTEAAAVLEAHLLDINPGGEVQVISTPPGFVVPEQWANRLLDKAEIERMNHDLGSFNK
jgi:hypothetical protein